jgi:hypothetical protein
MHHHHTKDWIDIVAAFAPLLAVLVAVLVALMQWHLQREQWKQTLYRDRSKVYWAVMDLWEILANSDASIDRRAFATAVLPATHLFGADLQRFLSKIKQGLFQIEGMYSPAERTRARAALAGYISHDFETQFDQYLQLHHDDSLFFRAKAQIDRWVEGADARMASRLCAHPVR